MALGAGMTLAACAQESLVPDAGRDGAPVEVSFDIGLQGALTKADTPESTAFDNAGGTFQLYVAAFDKADGALYEASLVGGDGFQAVGSLSKEGAGIHLMLPRSKEFRVVFFAQHEDAYDVRFADGNTASFAFKSSMKANDGALDAFCAVVDVTAARTSYEVTMKRPFAQLNVLVPADNVPEGKTTFSSSMTVSMPTSFDLLAGKAGTTLSEVTFSANAIDTDPFGKYARTHKWVAMNYVLVPENGRVDVKSFREAGMAAAVAPGEVPVKVNGRTNLVGGLYGMDLAFAVVLDAGFEDTGVTTQSQPGCYLPGRVRSYTAGKDQIVREYDGTKLTFVLTDPAGAEQMVLGGFDNTMAVGDGVTLSVNWKKGKESLLSGSYDMTVVKMENKTVWIADDAGNGFIIKK